MDILVDQDDTKWIDVKDVHTIVASKPAYKTILFSDGKTKLIDYLSSLENPKKYEKFLDGIDDVNIFLPNDSPLWPGSTPLHLAVMFSANMKDENKALQLFNQCLNQGASVQVQNQLGATPLHLAFRLDQQQIMALLLRSLEKKSTTVVNLVDNDNLSFLHIACAVKDHRSGLARKLLLDTQGTKAMVNIPYKGLTSTNYVKPGWTPLHVAVDQRQHYLTELLLQRDADTSCTDGQGSTVIHQLFGTTGTKPLADVLFASQHLKDCVHAITGLSHLHVAVWFDDVKSVERLLDEGADIEATVKTLLDRDMKKFEGCTALRMAMILDRIWCVKMLLKRGANVLAKNFNDNTSPLSAVLSGRCRNLFYIRVSQSITRAFIAMFWDDDKMQKLLEKELGLTKLHIACYAGNVDKITILIDEGADVNAKISDNSHFWRSYAPLHVLACTGFVWDCRKIAPLKKLMQSGCCIDQQDSTGKTALHLVILSESFDSQEIVETLLMAGADINIVDHSGNTAISYALDVRSRCKYECYRRDADHSVGTLTVLLYKMKLLKIDVCEVNENHRTTVLRNSANLGIISQNMNGFLDQLQETEKVIIGRRGLTLRSFLSETGAISIYPSLTPEDRSQVDAFFQSSINDKDSLDWKFLLNLQYRKAVTRLSLIDPAVDALKDFISPGFPDLCADIILKYLSNSELKLLIAASQIKD